MFKGIISVYSDLLVLISNYSFLFENSSSEIQALKGNSVSVVVALISEAHARDGANWYGYTGCNPMVYTDPTGLAPYINGIYDGPYNPDYNPGTPELEPQTQEHQKYYEPQGPNIPETSGVPDVVAPQPKTDNLWAKVKFNIEKWHFEDRSTKNNIYEFKNDADAYNFLSSLKEGEICNGWKREFRDAYHQDGVNIEMKNIVM